MADSNPVFHANNDHARAETESAETESAETESAETDEKWLLADCPTRTAKSFW